MRIHHLGLVVSNLEDNLNALGLSVKDIKETVYDPLQKNNLHFIHLEKNNLWLELVEPTVPTASTAKFAKKHGLGLHHLGFATTEYEAVEGLYKKCPGAFILGRYAINVKSFGGSIRTLFIAVHGLIIEYVAQRK